MVSLYGILQICGIDFLRWEVERTALSTLGRRNFAGEYLVMVIPYVYYLLYKEKKWYLYIVLLFLISHLVFTFTRASYIAFFVSSVVFFILVSKRISLNKKAIIFLCILLFSYNAFSDIKTFEKGTVKSRFLIWSITLKMIKSNPLMGVGPGNFFVMYPYYAIGEEKALRGISLVVDRAHNDYLDICAETGITGIFLFLYLLYCFFKVCIILYRDIDRKRKLLIAGIISSVVAMCINALASFPFNNPATLFLFWTNVSFAGGIYRKVKGERSVKVSYSIVKFYLVIFAITGIVLSYRGIKAGRCAFLAKVFKGKQSLQFAESAVAYNPFSFKYLHFAGTTALNLGEYQKAYELLTKGINLHPYYDSTHNNLGLIYLFIGDIEKAESSFFTALKLNPDNYEFNNNIGFLYLTTKDYEKAINYLTKAIQLKPDAYLSFYSLGVAYYMKKQYSEAKEQFRKVLEINPDFYPAKEYLEKISR
ncbi:MAG: tetratricopeptide repeat protein [bacterium]|nr:tetratricopeptide repeat protein [bacterium]